MDPHGPIARRFPLVARFRPACSPLPARVRSLAELAVKATNQDDQGVASAVFNQAALVASDTGLPDLARSMCHRHAEAYLRAGPLPAMSAIRGLEPLVNLARLQIRAGHNDDGRQRLLDLYEAVGTGHTAVFEGITVPADLTCTDEDRREVHAWLWRVVLADGTRSLTAQGRWREALSHIERHRGVGTRMLDGRQVAVVAALTEGHTERAVELLTGTAPGDAWEQAVTACLTALCRRDTGQNLGDDADELVSTYFNQEAQPGRTVFDIRLGLTVLDAVGARHPAAHQLVENLFLRTRETLDGYAAREVLAHALFTALVSDNQAQECRDMLLSCGLGTGIIADDLAGALSAALDAAEAVITRSLNAVTPR
ncbi:hypothetical protein [Streptomyces sp. MST-110588]|uniref:hypothetical protein n=1 Tax=Streptomyces sp. MST-110588 TaxID=2833628 RepID=UPI001F5D29B3|nr:hypothetical protein [Streptomyces sp. MST-110588]UNO42155.1 hypothetical protein KGS77_24870 [Streptomyces sp. MST-110588]